MIPELQDLNICAQRMIVEPEQLRNFGLEPLTISDLESGNLKISPVNYYDFSNPVSSSVSLAEFSLANHQEVISIHNFSTFGITEKTLFSCDSMAKMITASCILRMIEEDEYQKLDLKENPDSSKESLSLDTKLSTFLPILKKHFKSSFIHHDLEQQPNFTLITIQHLINHTSGLSIVDDLARNQILQSKKTLDLDEIIDAPKKPRIGIYGENINEYRYNNLGYELLGRIIIAMSNEVLDQQSKPRLTFGEVIDKLVIDRVKEKIGSDQAQYINFFTADQIETTGNITRPILQPSLKVEFSDFYLDQRFSKIPSHTYDLSSGGCYADCNSMNIIAFHLLHNIQEYSIFKSSFALQQFNTRTVEIPKLNPDGSYKTPSGKVYGFGYESFSDPNFQQYRSHGGLGYGSNSIAFIDTKNNKSAVIMLSFENLTLPIAYAITHHEAPTKLLKVNGELHQKSIDLKTKYSNPQLLEMRIALDKSYHDFLIVTQEIDSRSASPNIKAELAKQTSHQNSKLKEL